MMSALYLADPTSRSALLWHERGLRREKLSSLFEACGADVEIYRVQSEPGIGEGDLRLVEARVFGDEAVVTERRFGQLSPTAAPPYGWHRAYSATRTAEPLRRVREKLAAVLRTHAAAAVADSIVDAPRLYVETCRRGRYHYFERAVLGRREPAEVIELARSLLSLGQPWTESDRRTR